jgi:secondary thiamine-phosphate synthase enzyme
MEVTIKTKNNDEIIDITDEINSLLSKSSIGNGLINAFVKHTTCGLTTADLDPGTDKDFLNFLRKIQPDVSYNHPHNPKHTPDHLLSSLIGPSVTIPIENKKLSLGTWQRVILVELNGPRERTIYFSIINSR